ncbi:antibiotic biosynthesis monooxygenase [Hyphomicrobiales bacterium]|jgi:quinol monooxygenase YgiN|nr:antibiotic biosynthesis monooxygenase [Hyphomicrobiales bacterium]MDA8893078.1 antibiotic biosynthesis monooxygenase [Hyphomicrobiales bacterium]MDB9926099.1 antibiotic biosynthesis monooxygenase [Hyphomicrobiales bacterium]|tara:strand:+ start:113 stop:466 length:354 start_codon:yes stop_codon:yes gene_type:complete
MIIISAVLDFESKESRDKVIEITADIQLATRNEEAGCISYCFAADPCVDNRIQVYELWEDEDSLVAHFSHHTYFKMVEALNSVGIRNTENQMYLIEKHKPVYDENGNSRTVLFNDAS